MIQSITYLPLLQYNKSQFCQNSGLTKALFQKQNLKQTFNKNKLFLSQFRIYEKYKQISSNIYQLNQQTNQQWMTDNEIQPLNIDIPNPHKKQHKIENFRCDNDYLKTYPMAKGESLRKIKSSTSDIYKDCYDIARLNNFYFVRPNTSKLSLYSSQSIESVAEVYCGTIKSIKSVCPLPNTNLVLAVASEKNQNSLIVCDFEVVRSRKCQLPPDLKGDNLSINIINQTLIVVCSDVSEAKMLKITGNEIQNFGVQKIGDFKQTIFTKVRALNGQTFAASIQVPGYNCISFNDVQRMYTQREVLIDDTIYCISRFDDNLVGVGGRTKKVMFYDRRVYKCIWSIHSEESWVSDIVQIGENRLLFTDWNKLIDVDIRKSTRISYGDNFSGIWSICLLNESKVATISSCPNLQLFEFY